MQHNGNSLEHIDAAQLHIACVHSGTELAEKHYNELSDIYSFVPPKESDVILALGGDGLMLHALHSHMNLKKPIYGMNCGTIGFLMNEYSEERPEERLEAAQEEAINPLAMKAERRTEVSGEEAFKLHDTYGFPVEFTEEICREQGLGIDHAGGRQSGVQYR